MDTKCTKQYYKLEIPQKEPMSKNQKMKIMENNLMILSIIFLIIGIIIVTLVYQLKRDNQRLKEELQITAKNYEALIKEKEIFSSINMKLMENMELMEKASNLINEKDEQISKFDDVYDEMKRDLSDKRKRIRFLEKNIKNIGTDLRINNPVGMQYKIGDKLWIKDDKDKIVQRKVTGITIEVFETEYDVYYQFETKRNLIERHEDLVFLTRDLAEYFL